MISRPANFCLTVVFNADPFDVNRASISSRLSLEIRIWLQGLSRSDT